MLRLSKSSSGFSESSSTTSILVRVRIPPFLDLRESWTDSLLALMGASLLGISSKLFSLSPSESSSS